MKAAIIAEAAGRCRSSLEGARSFLAEAPATPRPEAPPAIWQAGSARLLDYGDDGNRHDASRVVLLIPSLINRYYILDLTEKRSLARFLAAEGHQVYLLDWGLLEKADHSFSIEDYLRERLVPAVRYLTEKHARPLIPFGYCMGGLMTLALAQLYPDRVERLALLATPWNFHADDAATLRLSPPTAQKALAWLEAQSHLPGETIPFLFHLSDPWRFQEKFIEYGKIKSPNARRYFDEIERWANDCVPLAKGVARECLIAWLHGNDTFHGRWEIAGQKINPAMAAQECFFVAPQHDRVVSPLNCSALVDIMPRIQLHKLNSGHIGVLTGARRKSQLWEPLAAWLRMN